MYDLNDIFPAITTYGFRKTSEATERYNCVAWAALDDKKWWDPTPFPGYYWPDGIPRSASLAAIKKVFRDLGYRTCQSAEPEIGFEKIAIYGNNGLYEHVARQLKSGKWTSKLGALEDIEHDSLAALVGTEYGAVSCLMKRKIDYDQEDG